MIYKKIDPKIYPINITFIDTDDKHFIYEKKEFEFNQFAMSCFRKHNNFYMILNLKHKQYINEKNEIFNTIAHEAGHLSSMIFQHLNINMELNNDDPYQSLVGFIVEQGIEFIRTNKTFWVTII